MKRFVVVLAILSSFLSQGQEKMQWFANVPLTWDDFKGQPQSGSYVATTNSGISFSYAIQKKNNQYSVTYTIESFFYPYGSWYQKDKVTPQVLKHEQTHFDITELHARKFRKRMEAISTERNPKREIQNLFNTIEKERKEMQEKFDLETNHSINKEEEKAWENYVQKQLELYRKWN